MCVFKVLTVNARGLANETKQRAFFDYHRQNADILLIQETHSSEEMAKYWEAEWGGKIIYSHGTTSARGVAACFTKSMFQLVERFELCHDGRTILFDIKISEIVITFVVVYAPNEDTPSYFEGISKKLQSMSEHKITLGDFNLALDVSMDRKNTFNNNKAMKEVENIMDEYFLKDIWRIRNEDKKEYSWIKKLVTGEQRKASRIDFALVSSGLDQYVKHVTYISSIKTDHRALYMAIDTTQGERGTGYWKLNTEGEDMEIKYVEMMNNEIDRTIQSASMKDPLERWEILKDRIKKMSIKYAREKSHEQKEVIAQLSLKANEYEENLPLQQEEDDLYVSTKNELEDQLMMRTQGVMFRSKAKWYEEGERNTKYFYALEKARYNAKTCHKLVTDKGEEITDPKLILEEQRNFYRELYSEDEMVKFTLSNNSDIVVPEEIRLQQEIQITTTDLEEAIKAMNNNKTSGEDGLPVDFYKCFWTKLRTAFLDMVLAVYEKGVLHTTARQGVLNLIPKANKDTRYIKNLRPITLLNVDYKIIEKAIANKMIPALTKIIHHDQRGFMKERRISVNIRKLLDIMHIADDQELEAAVLSLDFVKCFDRCSFSILHGSLKYFQFGSIVQEWTQILYNQFTVKIQNNGYFSERIPISKGVHQGGCCSSVYFLVIAEILAIALRANDEIDGIKIKGIRHLLNQFADDMDVASLCTEKSIRNIFKELELFKWQSGFQLSYEKTTLYRIGSLKYSCARLYNLDEVKWSNEDINVLGVTISHQDIVEKNYSMLVNKTKQVLNSWSNRNLSLLGKVQVVNTMVASQMVYKMMVLPMMPRNIIKNIENLIRSYIWSGKKSKISFSILQNPKREGGLNLVNLH